MPKLLGINNIVYGKQYKVINPEHDFFGLIVVPNRHYHNLVVCEHAHDPNERIECYESDLKPYIPFSYDNPETPPFAVGDVVTIHKPKGPFEHRDPTCSWKPRWEFLNKKQFEVEKLDFIYTCERWFVWFCTDWGAVKIDAACCELYKSKEVKFNSGKYYEAKNTKIEDIGKEDFVLEMPPKHITRPDGKKGYLLEKSQVETRLYNFLCPRCSNGNSSSWPADYNCPTCGFPGLKSLPNTCRHYELYAISEGPHKGKIGCLDCKARFKVKTVNEFGNPEFLYRRGPDTEELLKEIKLDPNYLNPNDFLVAEYGYLSFELNKWKWRFYIYLPDNEAAQPPPGGWGWIS